MFDNFNGNQIIALDIEKDLIKTTSELAENMLTDEIHNVVVLFPNRRAVRFFERFLNKSAFLRVEAFSLPDFVKNTVFSKTKGNYFYQQEIDRYFLILDLIKKNLPDLYKKLGNKEDRVFPWCIRISKLFNDFDKELIENVKKVEFLDNVVNEAKEIMMQLDILYSFYREELDEKQLTFSGDLFRKISDITLKKNTGFIFSGFTNFSKGEKKFVDNVLAYNKSFVLFQTDLQNRHGKFNPYDIYEEWLNGNYFGEKPLKWIDGKVSKTNINFYESFDLHSSCQQYSRELNNLFKEVADDKNPLKTAVVLSEEKALIPVLNSTLEGNINITMGFPFAKSVISQILNSFIYLAESTNDKGYYHKPLLSLLNTKLIKNIEIEEFNYEELLEKLTNHIVLQGIPFVSFDYLSNFSTDELEKLKIFEKNVLLPFINANSMFKVGKVFQSILIYLESFFNNNRSFNFERQIAENFIENFLFKISEAESSKKIFENKQIIYSILKSIVENISINFEGNPLTGIQVMGMLEARMLKFKNIFIFDVNEGILPPDNKVDPLIPDIIKKEIGIPSFSDVLKRYKYYFFRLIDSCENVCLFFQKGENNEEKKIKSRYIEQLLYEKEYEMVENSEQIKIKELENKLINSEKISVSSNTKMHKFEKLLSKMEFNLKEKTLSASAINNFISCPLKFYLSNILKVEEESKIIESQDPRNVGDIIHNILEIVLKDYKSEVLNYKLIKEMEVKVIEKTKIELENQLKQLSKLRVELLLDTAIFRLKSYFKNLFIESKDSQIMFVDFEKGFSLNFNGHKFYGVVDRIDYIENSIEKYYKIIDYKTGTYAKTPNKNIGKKLEGFDFDDFSKENQKKLFKELKSIQLPLYNFMISESNQLDTSYEEIKSSLYLLGSGVNEELESIFEGKYLSEEKFKFVLSYILECMNNVKNYYFNDSNECSFCPHYKACLFTSHIGN